MTRPPEPRLPPIDDLNQLGRAELGLALRPLFEAAAPLARALYAARPFTSYEDLIDHAESLAIYSLPRAEQIEVLNAHPRIGERAARVSTLSFREQGYDRDAGQPPEEVEQLYTRLDDLNRAYEARFGFRFVVFVNQRPRSEIADVLQQRLANDDPQQELLTGLRDMFLIARDRLRGLRRE